MKHLNPRSIQMLIDGEASQDETLWADRHVRECAGCRAKLEQAGAALRAVMKDLEGLDPVSVPSPPAFDRSLEAEGPKKPLIRALALAPIRVPAFLLVLMAGMLIFLTCLLYVVKPYQKDTAVNNPGEEAADYLTLVSSGGETRISLNTPAHRYKLVENPSILVIRKENANE